MIPEAQRILLEMLRATACEKEKERRENTHPNNPHGNHDIGKPMTVGMMTVTGEAKDKVRGQALLLPRGGSQ